MRAIHIACDNHTDIACDDHTDTACDDHTDIACDAHTVLYMGNTYEQCLTNQKRSWIKNNAALLKYI